MSIIVKAALIVEFCYDQRSSEHSIKPFKKFNERFGIL